MSTTTDAQDQDSVTVPLNLNLLQSLLSLQLVQLTQPGGNQQKPGNNTNRPISKDPAQNQRPKTQLALDKPANGGQTLPKGTTLGANVMSNMSKQTTEISVAQEAKKEQVKQGSSSGVNMQNPLALLTQLAQLNQMGLGNLLSQVTGNQNLQNKSNGPGNMNESSNGSMGKGVQSKFKYSSTLGGERPQQREDSNSRTRPFQNRQNNFNNNDGNNFNFRNRGNGGNFQQRGNGNFQQRGGPNQMRGRNFNNFNGPRNQNDFSRSREREKSTGRFGGMSSDNQRNGNNQDGRRGPFIPNSRKGDWVCPNEECKNVNFAVRSQCNRCGVEKPQELIELEEERRNNAPTFKKGDWNCPNCKNLNFAKRSNCNRCEAERPEETYEDYRPRKYQNQDQDGGFGFGFGDNDNYEPGEVSNNQNDWVNGNEGNDGLEDGEVA